MRRTSMVETPGTFPDWKHLVNGLRRPRLLGVDKGRESCANRRRAGSTPPSPRFSAVSKLFIAALEVDIYT
jgi:hypothetical protein